MFILYISIGKVADGQAPIYLAEQATNFSNPLPHVLILTAIVVSVATTAVGLALVVRIREAYGSVEEDDIHAMELEQEENEECCYTVKDCNWGESEEPGESAGKEQH